MNPSILSRHCILCVEPISLTSRNKLTSGSHLECSLLLYFSQHLQWYREEIQMLFVLTSDRQYLTVNIWQAFPPLSICTHLKMKTQTSN